MDQFYTYIYFDPSRSDEPIYVGKGHGSRSHDHLKKKGRHPFTHRLQKMKRQGIYPVISRIDVSSEENAFLLEKGLIRLIGRKDLGRGPLLNLTDGGQGAVGLKYTAEQRIRRKQILADPDLKERIRTQLKKTLATPEGKANKSAAMKLVRNTPEAKARQSQITSALWADPEYRARQSLLRRRKRGRYKSAPSKTGNLLKFFT